MIYINLHPLTGQTTLNFHLADHSVRSTAGANMAEGNTEMAQVLNSHVGDNGVLSSPSPSASEMTDLEKANTVADPTPAVRATPTATAEQPELWRSRSVATDGFCAYCLEEHENDFAGSNLTVQRTPTDAYEVRWIGKDDNSSPRNFSLARKWLIVSIVSFSSFLV